MSVPPTDPGRMLRAFGAIAARVGHLDNTGEPCRIEWDGKHDACAVCEAFGAVLASLRTSGIDADTLSKRMPDLTLADWRAADPLGRAPVIGPLTSAHLKARAARTVARMAKP